MALFDRLTHWKNRATLLTVWVIPAKGAALSNAIHTVTPIGRQPRVAIIGAGVMGLGIAWRLAPRATVTVFDRGKAGAGASHAAAGMLAACCEAEPGEEALVALGRESQARWPSFAASSSARAASMSSCGRRHAGAGAHCRRSGRDRPPPGVSARP